MNETINEFQKLFKNDELWIDNSTIKKGEKLTTPTPRAKWSELDVIQFNRMMDPNVKATAIGDNKRAVLAQFYKERSLVNTFVNWISGNKSSAKSKENLIESSKQLKERKRIEERDTETLEEDSKWLKKLENRWVYNFREVVKNMESKNENLLFNKKINKFVKISPGKELVNIVPENLKNFYKYNYVRPFYNPISYKWKLINFSDNLLQASSFYNNEDLFLHMFDEGYQEADKIFLEGLEHTKRYVDKRDVEKRRFIVTYDPQDLEEPIEKGKPFLYNYAHVARAENEEDLAEEKVLVDWEFGVNPEFPEEPRLLFRRLNFSFIDPDIYNINNAYYYVDYKEGLPLYPMEHNLGEWAEEIEDFYYKAEEVGPELIAISQETDPSINEIMFDENSTKANVYEVAPFEKEVFNFNSITPLTSKWDTLKEFLPIAGKLEEMEKKKKNIQKSVDFIDIFSGVIFNKEKSFYRYPSYIKDNSLDYLEEHEEFLKEKFESFQENSNKMNRAFLGFRNETNLFMNPLYKDYIQNNNLRFVRWSDFLDWEDEIYLLGQLDEALDILDPMDSKEKLSILKNFAEITLEDEKEISEGLNKYKDDLKNEENDSSIYIDNFFKKFIHNMNKEYFEVIYKREKNKERDFWLKLTLFDNFFSQKNNNDARSFVNNELSTRKEANVLTFYNGDVDEDSDSDNDPDDEIFQKYRFNDFYWEFVTKECTLNDWNYKVIMPMDYLHEIYSNEDEFDPPLQWIGVSSSTLYFEIGSQGFNLFFDIGKKIDTLINMVFRLISREIYGQGNRENLREFFNGNFWKLSKFDKQWERVVSIFNSYYNELTNHIPLWVVTVYIWAGALRHGDDYLPSDLYRTIEFNLLAGFLDGGLIIGIYTFHDLFNLFIEVILEGFPLIIIISIILPFHIISFSFLKELYLQTFCFIDIDYLIILDSRFISYFFNLYFILSGFYKLFTYFFNLFTYFFIFLILYCTYKSHQFYYGNVFKRDISLYFLYKKYINNH